MGRKRTISGRQALNNKWVAFYDDLAKTRSDPVSQSGYVIDGKPIEEEVFEAWVQHIQQHLDARPEHALLDVGCGSGLFLKRFSRFTGQLYGVDTSAEQIKNAKINCPAAHLRVGSALDAGFGGQRFGRIICNGVFLLFDSLFFAKVAAKYIVSISAPDAKIWIGDLPMPTQEMRPDGNYRRKGKANGLELQHFPVDFFSEICSELGVEGYPTAAFRYDFLIINSPPVLTTRTTA
jgi:cyclopropane fatty-acyl-phospholipid synthase-like methyltransferase